MTELTTAETNGPMAEPTFPVMVHTPTPMFLGTHRHIKHDIVRKDPAEIIELAQDRKRWRRLASQIKKAAEVSQTKNWNATRQ